MKKVSESDIKKVLQKLTPEELDYIVKNKEFPATKLSQKDMEVLKGAGLIKDIIALINVIRSFGKPQY